MHDSSDDLSTYLERQNRYTTLAARQAFEQGRSAGVFHLLCSPVVRFIKFYLMRLGFLDGLPGLLHISIGCINSYMKYAQADRAAAARKTSEGSRTGAAGFIGMHAAQRLLERGDEVIGVDNLSPYYSVKLKKDRLARLKHRRFRFHKLDLAKAGALEALSARRGPARCCTSPHRPGCAIR
jgi:hypothetical protein